MIATQADFELAVLGFDLMQNGYSTAEIAKAKADFLRAKLDRQTEQNLFATLLQEQHQANIDALFA